MPCKIDMQYLPTNLLLQKLQILTSFVPISSTKNKAYFALAATSIIWGTTWTAMKFGIKGLPPFELAAIRHIIAGSGFVLFFLLVKKEKLPTLQQFKRLTFLGITTFVLANALSTWSLKYISSGLGALIGALYPLCVVLLEYFFYNNKNISKLTVFGIVLGIGGIAFVFQHTAFVAQSSEYLFGILLSVIAMLSWSYSSILISKKYIQINSYYGMGWQMLVSFVICIALSLCFEKPVALTAIPAVSWWAVVYLIIAGSVIAMVAFVYTMKHLNPAIAVMYAYINPIVAMFAGFIFLNDTITLHTIIGSLITLTGVFLVNYSLKKLKQEELANLVE